MKDWLDEEIEREGLTHNRSEKARRREEMFLANYTPEPRLLFHRDSEDARSLKREHEQAHAAAERQGNLNRFQSPKPKPRQGINPVTIFIAIVVIFTLLEFAVALVV